MTLPTLAGAPSVVWSRQGQNLRSWQSANLANPMKSLLPENVYRVWEPVLPEGEHLPGPDGQRQPGQWLPRNCSSETWTICWQSEGYLTREESLLFTPTPTAGATSGDDHAVPLQVEGISVGGANNCEVNTSLNNLARIPDELCISDQSQLVLPERRRPRPTLPCVCVRNVVIFGPRLLSGHVRAVILLALRGA